MLAQMRSGSGNRSRRRRQFHRWTRHRESADLRKHPALGSLWILADFVQRLDRCAGDSTRAKMRDPMRARSGPKNTRDQRLQHFAILHAQRVSGIIRMLCEIGPSDRPAEIDPQFPACDRDHDIAIGGWKSAIGNNSSETRAQRPWNDARAVVIRTEE